MTANPTIHANCVVLGEAGVLIRGRSGAGKSTLSLALIERAATLGMFARLVADDRVRLTTVEGRLIASVPATIAGLIERRGVGIVQIPYLAEAVVRLVVDIENCADGNPDPDNGRICMRGVDLPLLRVARGDQNAASHVLFGLRTCFSARSCDASTLAFASQHENVSHSAPHAPIIRTDRARVARRGPDPERSEFCAETA